MVLHLKPVVICLLGSIFFISFFFQGHYLLGIIFEQMGKYRQSLTAFLTALNVDYESDHADMLVNNVCLMCSQFCLMSNQFLERMPGTLN